MNNVYIIGLGHCNGLTCMRKEVECEHNSLPLVALYSHSFGLQLNSLFAFFLMYLQDEKVSMCSEVVNS